MNLTPGERILHRAVADVLSVPRQTHKELTNKRASVMLTEKIEKDLEVIAQTGLIKWAFIPCFQQMFQDTNALPMSLHPNPQMVLDFLAYCHEKDIQVRAGRDDLCALALVRGGEPVSYRGSKRPVTPLRGLREAIDVDAYNAATLSGEDVVKSLDRHHLAVASRDGGEPDTEPAARIDEILASLRAWMPVIDDHQDRHAVLDVFRWSLEESGLDVRQGD